MMSASRVSTFLTELKRRKVYHVGAVYVVVAFALWEGAEIAFPRLGLPDWTVTLVLLLTLVGFPVALLLAWAYEIRPEEVGPRDGRQILQGRPRGGRYAIHVSPKTYEGTEDSLAEVEPDPRPAIAVLPFDDFSPNPQDAYFANGMHEEILTQLQRIKGLAVRGRTSVLRYRDEPKDLREIAEELGVRFVMEGSARKAGGQVRLTAQLIDARKDEHLWAENYDRPLTVDNLIAVQSDIAHQVADTVGVLLSPEEETRLNTRPTQDLKAYDYYLLARHHLHLWHLAHIEEAVGFLRRSVEVDGAFAQGYAGLAYAYSALGVFGQPPQETWPNARAAAEQALAMDETQAEAHTALALEALSHRYDWERSEAGFREALLHNPNQVEALDWLGLSLAGIWGRFGEAKAFARKARETDPLSLTVRYHVGIPHVWAGELDVAREAFEALEDSGPARLLRLNGLSWVLMARGEYKEALEIMKDAADVAEERVVIFTGMLGHLYGRTGSVAEARSQLARLKEFESRGIYVDPVTRAQVHSGIGEPDQTLALLEKAYTERTHWMIYLGNIPWAFEELQSEPRFRELLRRMDFPRLR